MPFPFPHLLRLTIMLLLAAPASVFAASPGEDGGEKAREAEPVLPNPALDLAPSTFDRGPATTGAMALTFDDGPHVKQTPRLIAILKKKNVPATFFMLGLQVEKYPEVARQVAEAGFEIGNHSYSHRDLTKLSREEIREEIERTNRLIERATGKKPRLFRPPYRKMNDKVEQVVYDLGMDIVTWDVDPRDWERKNKAAPIAGHTIDHAHKGGIVCIHDIYGRTVDAVPNIIERLRAEGYAFRTAGEMIAAERRARAEAKLRKEATPTASAAASTNPSIRMSEPEPVVIPLGRTSLKSKYAASPQNRDGRGVRNEAGN